MPLPALHTPAPAFSLPDQDGNIHSLADYAGKWVILYFYPKDDTPGCTKEACGFSDLAATLAKKNCVIIGVSPDGVKKHKKFAEKFGLRFTLLADEEKKLIEAYDLWKEKKFMGRTYMGVLRTSFLIDPKGMIAKIYEGVSPEDHPEEVLRDLDALAS